jgi:putative spermidine/putrescine transport system permease protein
MSSETKQILTTDGIPLEVSLKKAEKKNKIKAFLLVAPLLLFLIITYIFPIGDMFMRSVDDKMITNMLPKTFKAMEKWENLDELPPEEVFSAFYFDFKLLVKKREQGKLGQRLNKEKNGFNSITKKLLRQIKRKKIDENANIKEQLMKVHKRWRSVEYWQAIKRTAPPYTMAKYLKGMDMYFAADGSVAQVEEDRRIHRILWLRTLEIAFFVTLF